MAWLLVRQQESNRPSNQHPQPVGCWGSCCGPPDGIPPEVDQEYNVIGESRPSFSESQVPFCKDFKDEFRCEKLTLRILPYERGWLKQYGETMFSTNYIWNIAVKTVFVATMLWGQWLSTRGWGSNFKFYGIYLTYWTLTVQNLYHLANLGMAIQAAYRKTPICYTVQVTTLLRSIAEPCALIVTVIYGTGTAFEDRSLTNLMIHAVNAIVILLDAMLGRQVSRLANNVWAFVYMLTFAMWTYVHYLLNLGDQYGHNYIYATMNWDDPTVAWYNFWLVFFFVMPLTAFLLWSIVWARDRIIADTDRLRFLAWQEERAKRPWWKRMFNIGG